MVRLGCLSEPENKAYKHISAISRVLSKRGIPVSSHKRILMAIKMGREFNLSDYLD